VAGPIERAVPTVQPDHAGAVPVALADQPVIEFDALCRRVMGDRELAFILIEKAAKNSGRDLDEINLAWQSRDFERLRKAAHKLKGSSANLSAEPLRQVCEEIELASRDGDEHQLAGLFETLLQSVSDFQFAVEKLLQNKPN
jgi:HPt (histidine-containing phosphotransfer) domain-containing protein